MRYLRLLFLFLLVIISVAPLSVASMFTNRAIAQNASTHSTWQLNAAGDIVTLLPIQDISGDKINDIVILSTYNVIYSIDGATSKTIWSYTASSFFPWLSALTSSSLDIDGDSKPEILVGAKNGFVMLLDGNSGKQLWNYTDTTQSNYKYGDSCYSGTRFIGLISDIDKDGHPDAVLVSGTGDLCTKDDTITVSAISTKNGHKLWDFTHKEDNHGLKDGTKGSAPVILVDANKDGINDILIADDQSILYTINGSNGNLIGTKKLPIYGSIWHLIDIPDITGDGVRDAIALEYIDQKDQGPNFASVDAIDIASNKVIWQNKLGDGFITSGAVYSAIWLTDSNTTDTGQKKQETRIAYTGRIEDNQDLTMVDAKNGSLLWKFSLGSESTANDFAKYYAISIIPDLDGDGHDELAVSKTDSTFYLLGVNDAKALWTYPIGGIATDITFLSAPNKQEYGIVGNSHAEVVALAGLSPIPTKITIETSAQTIELSLSSNVVISGQVSPSFPGDFVQIHYITPSRSVIERTVKIDTDGSYSDRLKPDQLGTWQVSADFKAKGYYVDSKSKTVSFAVQNEKRSSVYDLQVSVDGGKTKTTYPIVYLIDGANVTNMSINDQMKRLDISLSSSKGGTLKIELPKAVIDTWDPKFNVIVDGQTKSYEELTSDNKDIRIVSISFPSGANQIQIQGTYVVPEFSGAAIVVLAVTIVALIGIHNSLNLRKMWNIWK